MVAQVNRVLAEEEGNTGHANDVAACSTFLNRTLEEKVLESEQWLLDWFGLDKCCSR